MVQPITDVGKQLHNSALYVLDIFPLSYSTKDPSHTLPDAEEVQETLSSLMPAPEEILSNELIKAALFPIYLVRGVAKPYNSSDLQEVTITSMGT